MRTTRTLLAASAAALALTVTGCGAAGTGPVVQQAAELAPEALLKLVGEKTGAAKSAKVEATTVLGTASMSYQGAISWKSGLEGELSGKAMAGPLADAMAATGGDGGFKARYLSDAMYVNMGDGMAAQLAGRHWLRYGYEDLAKLMGAAGESMKSQFKSADPVAAVNTLIATGKVTKVGPDPVNGTPATKYSGDISAADISRLGANGLSADQTAALQKQFDTAGITTEHVEVWVGADNLLLKKSEQFESKKGSMSATAVYSDYGVAVNVTAPPASDTMDFAEVLKAAKR